MTAPVDVLAVLDRLIGNARTMAGLSGDPLLRENLRDGEKARDAVAELIEADKEYDTANHCWDLANSGDRLDPKDDLWKRFADQYEAAIARRASALARAQGVQS